MKNFLFAMCAFLSVIMLTNCTQQLPASEELSLSWELISNDFSEKPKAKARLTIENKSSFDFSEKNWALFYNHAPRIPLSSTGNTKMEHISGDWFKLSPEAGFKLAAGEKIEIEYETEAWLIKECDAPVGPYFVFYNTKGEEKAVVPVSNYTILPFAKPELATRHRGDAEPVPTAAWQFNENKDLAEVADDELLPFIPSPAEYKSSGEKVVFDEQVEILYEKELENEAKYLAEVLFETFGANFAIQEAAAPKANAVFLGKANAVKLDGEEAYRLEVKKNKSVEIRGNNPAGVFYGIQSLVAMLPVDLFLGREVQVTLDEMVISDAPRFPYRGMHLDVARNFQNKETLKKTLDILAFYKINHVLLYMTEDEGWRIEIEELPELTEVGGQRGHTTKEANALHPSYGSGPIAYAEGSAGSGFYTREDFIEILHHAKSRHINIIPEVCFPGHARSAIKAMEVRYERFMKLGDEAKANEFRLIDPEETSKYRSAQWYSDNIMNVARESTYKFYETVIDDIIEMYKEAGVELEYIHTGGDEVPEGSWSESPMCADLMKKHPEYKDPKNLQAYGTRRVVEMLRKKGMKIGGWEEVALLKDNSGKYNPNPEFVGKEIYPYVWNNLGHNTDLSYRLANAGYPVIMCNVSSFYFDLAYNKDPRESGLYWAGFCNTRDAWQVAPFDLFKTTTHTSMGAEIDLEKDYANMEHLKPEARKNIVGVQAQIWAETIKDGQDDFMYRILPKLMGFAETAWSPERKWETIENKQKREEVWTSEWNVFANTLAKRDLPRLKNFMGGYNYRVPAPGGKIVDGKLQANSSYPGLTIRYTTDGSEPTQNSDEYKAPVAVNGNVTIKAFDAAGKGSLSMKVD